MKGKFLQKLLKRPPKKKVYDLSHFENVQENIWDTAYAEISAGRKESHWIWYIFPQLKGLGVSKVSEDYGIDGLEEAKQYLEDRYLHDNLVFITDALLNCSKDDIHEIVSYPDDFKIRSCMTLFYYAANSLSGTYENDRDLFKTVIDKYYDGQFDKRTEEMLKWE